MRVVTAHVGTVPHSVACQPLASPSPSPSPNRLMLRSPVDSQPPALADAGGLILAPLPYAPLRVLCVDDNEDAADSLGILLRMTGFVAEVCRDPAAALELAGRFHPEACVLDIT